MIFLVVLSGKMIFFSPKIWSCSLDEKWKVIFLKKIHGNIIFSSNAPKRWSFQKKSRWDMIFFVLSGKMVHFFQKIWYFLFGRKIKDDLSQEIHGNIFSVYMYKCYKYDVTLLQTKSKMIFSQKITLKSDWHSRKSSNDSQYFYGDLHRCFHILLSSEKKQEI